MSELLQTTLKNENFDGLLILDVDSRIPHDFLDGLAAHLRAGHAIVQSSIYAKKPYEPSLQRTMALALYTTRHEQ